MDVGTLFYTWLWGRQVGTDQFGNRYYEHKSKRVANGKLKRWILYKGLTEASKVPPKWHAWLHYNLEELPSGMDINTKRLINCMAFSRHTRFTTNLGLR